METKNCYVKLVRLDSILFENTPDADNNKFKEDTNTSTTTPISLPSLRPRKRSYRNTRHPRQASQNMDYNEPVVPLLPVKNKNVYIKNIKPNQSGPSVDRIKAQTSHSTIQPPISQGYPFLSLTLMMEIPTWKIPCQPTRQTQLHK